MRSTRTRGDDQDRRLRDQPTLATVSTAGIGFAAAAGLDGEGACVVVNGRTQDPAPESISSEKM